MVSGKVTWDSREFRGPLRETGKVTSRRGREYNMEEVVLAGGWL